MVNGVVIGLLHPGEMGAAIGRELRAKGHEVLRASEGRSAATAARAAAAGLSDSGSRAELARRSDVVLSVCPPQAAVAVASEVALARAAAGGPAEPDSRAIYVDANAVSPATSRQIALIAAAGRRTYVDGGIIGPPPTAAGRTRLYLSGPHAGLIRDLFAGTAVDARVVETAAETAADGRTRSCDGGIGAASAVKMAYAAWTKGTGALLLAIRALARAEGVEDVLLSEWASTQPTLAGRSRGSAASALAKGWRWVAEMEEIGASFAADGLPAGFHQAAAEIFRRSPRSAGTSADAAADATDGQQAVDLVVAALLARADGG